jgi:hypothetical protein
MVCSSEPSPAPGSNSAGSPMDFKKALLEKSANQLMKKAEDCFGLAKAQHAIADKQHEIAARQHSNADQQDAIADRLDAIAQALEAEAVDIKGVMETDSARSSPCLREDLKRLSLASESAAPQRIPSNRHQ